MTDEEVVELQKKYGWTWLWYKGKYKDTKKEDLEKFLQGLTELSHEKNKV